MKPWLIAVLAFLYLCAPAFAQAPQPMCAPKEVILQSIMTGAYQERPAFAMTGMKDGSIPLTLYVGRDSGSWSIVLVRPDGIACIIVAGFGWEPLPPGDPA